MEPNQRPAGRPRIAPGRPGAAERWADALAFEGAVFDDARTEYDKATAALRDTVRQALLDGVHYRDVARLAGISMKMPARISNELRRAGQMADLEPSPDRV
jgi:hypothetical protein